MRRPAVMMDERWERAHGLGPMLVRAASGVLVGHVAEGSASSGWLLAAPGSGVGAVVMGNAGGATASLLPLAVSMIEEAGTHVPVRTPSLSPPPPPPVDEVLGRYAADGDAIHLAWRGGCLVAEGIPGAWPPPRPGHAFELLPGGTDAFRFADGPFCGELVRALRHPTGRIHGLEVCNRTFERA